MLLNSKKNNNLNKLILYLISIIMSISIPNISTGFNNKIRYMSMIEKFKDNISLKHPIDVFVDSKGEVYILDSSLGKIFIFNKDLMPVSYIDRANGLNLPICIAVDNSGRLYVSEDAVGSGTSGSILIFDTIGRKKKTILFEEKEWGRGFIAKDMTIDEKGNLYLVGGSRGKLIILSNEGDFIRMIRPIEKNKDGIEIKVDLAGVCLKGELIYLLSEWEGHIYVYDQEGNKVNVFGMKGGSTGKLSRPQSLAIDKKGICYVIDYMRHTLLMYDESGNYIAEYGGVGWGPGWFKYPKAIYVDTEGRLFIADSFNRRIQVFQTE